MDKKTMQRRRMMNYFIDAAHQIIEEQGMEMISIRAVAEKAGFNSATLYNYFKDLGDLIFFTSLGYLKEYALDLKSYTNDSQNALEWYLGIWRCFCKHSFKRPKIFQVIFFEKYSHSLNADIEKYYTIFPEELGDTNERTLKLMLMGNTIMERNMTLFPRLINEGIVREENASAISEMTCLIYQSLLSRFIMGEEQLSAPQLTEKMCVFAQQAIRAYN